MCMFSFERRRYKHQAPPVEVAATRIFARGLDGGQQVLVYSMQYVSAVDVAMILPLPTPRAPAEDAVRFIDLSAYPDFFQDLERGFPARPVRYTVMTMSARKAAPGAPPLKVHSVGSFEASFVPTSADFSRLDDRFRLPTGLLDQLPGYRDDAFAVFKLKPGRVSVHPMALAFPRRKPRELFFPTVHVHDGTLRRHAMFDHALYCQSPAEPRQRLPQEPAESRNEQDFPTVPRWTSSYAWMEQDSPRGAGTEKERWLAQVLGDGLTDEAEDREWVAVPASASSFVDMRKARLVVDGSAGVWRSHVRGLRANTDRIFTVAS